MKLFTKVFTTGFTLNLRFYHCQAPRKSLSDQLSDTENLLKRHNIEFQDVVHDTLHRVPNTRPTLYVFMKEDFIEEIPTNELQNLDSE